MQRIPLARFVIAAVLGTTAQVAVADPYVEHEPEPPADPYRIPSDEELVRLAIQEAHEEIITTTCAGMIPPMEIWARQRPPVVPFSTARVDDADQDGWSPTSTFSAQLPSIILDRDRTRGLPY